MSERCERIRVTAPDGMQVEVLVTAAEGMSVAEGIMPPQSTFSIHYHKTLEQVTYVLSGSVQVVSKARGKGRHDRTLRRGEWILTRPNESLQFKNSDPNETARVLFICCPPYPADDADTGALTDHCDLTQEELRASLERAKVMQTWAHEMWQRRIEQLQDLLE